MTTLRLERRMTYMMAFWAILTIAESALFVAAKTMGHPKPWQFLMMAFGYALCTIASMPRFRE